MNFFKKQSFSFETIDTLLQDIQDHEWIRNDHHIYRFFKECLTGLSAGDYQSLVKKKLRFIYSSGRFASTIPSSQDYNYIICYPELVSIIRSVDNSLASAIIFHEFGHIFFEHHKQNIDPLQKQIEADSFAIKYGLREEILELLSEENRTFEVVQRINTIENAQKTDH